MNARIASTMAIVLLFLLATSGGSALVRGDEPLRLYPETTAERPDLSSRRTGWPMGRRWLSP